MSEYHYTRKQLGGTNCGSGCVDAAGKTLAKVVEEALPGKAFSVRSCENDTCFDFPVALTGPEETTLANTQTAWTPVA